VKVTTVIKKNGAFEYTLGFCRACGGQERMARRAGSSGAWECMNCRQLRDALPLFEQAAADRAAGAGAPYQTRGGGARPRAGSGLRVVVSLSRDQLARIRPAGRALTSDQAAAVTRALAGEIANAFCRQVARAAVMNRARAKAAASQRARAERKARAAAGVERHNRMQAAGSRR